MGTMEITDEIYQQLIDEALGELPKRQTEGLQNVAILFSDDPTPEQRVRLQLHPGETLYGLYEGTPLAFRQGVAPLFPDRITLFKNPMLQASHSLDALKAQIKHTLWHEIGHFYGLDHKRIHEIEAHWQ